jgi:DNA sulfur modification protein DndE
MFTHIRTSKENKEVVSQLSRKLGLGAENVIARIAIAQSLENGNKLDVKNLSDSSGKEYSKSVLLGDYEELYLGMICTLYGIHKSHRDLGKLVKMHLDNGLQLIYEDQGSTTKLIGFNFFDK